MSTIGPTAPVVPAPSPTSAPRAPLPEGAANQTGANQAGAAPQSALSATPDPATISGPRQPAPALPQPTSLAPGTVVTAVLEQAPATPPAMPVEASPDASAPPLPRPAAAASPAAPPAGPQTATVPTTTLPVGTPPTVPPPAAAPLPGMAATPPPPPPDIPLPPVLRTPTPAPGPPVLPPGQMQRPATLLTALLNAGPAAPAPQAAPPAPTGVPVPQTPGQAAPTQMPQGTSQPPTLSARPAMPPAPPGPAPAAPAPSAAPTLATPARAALPSPPSGAAPTGGASPGIPTSPPPAPPPAQVQTPVRLQDGAAPPPTSRPGSAETLANPRTPAAPATAAPPSAAPPSAAPARPVVPQAGAPLSGAPVLALRPGTALVVQVTDMAPPRTGQPPPQGAGLTLQAGQMNFTGTVLGSTLAGQPIVDTPLGLFTLGAKVEVATGTRLGLQVVPPPGAGGPAVLGDQPASLAELSRGWAALDEALAALKASDPATARAVLEQTIARPGSQLAGGLAFFLAALRGGGDARRWLGETSVQALERSGRGKLVQRLSEEMQEMARAGSADSAQPGEWRPMLMPVFDNGGINQLRLYVQRDGGKDEDDADPAAGKRFMVDADFTRLGLVQLDGLVAGKRFDLVVRTTSALPDEMRKSINAIYTRSMDTAGFSGQLRFEAMPKLPTPDLNAVFGHAPPVTA